MQVTLTIPDEVAARARDCGVPLDSYVLGLIGQAPPSTFAGLAAAWRKERGAVSSVKEISTCPSYQRIIGMGQQAVPLILERLKRKPDHWFWALRAITGENPVPDEDRGNLAAMAKAWVAWGRANGYIG